MHDDDRPRERTNVARTPDGLIHLRTPEGQEIDLTPERAIEWTSSRDFIDRVRFAAIDCGALLRFAPEERP